MNEAAAKQQQHERQKQKGIVAWIQFFILLVYSQLVSEPAFVRFSGHGLS
jgi:hypothetical protein